MENNEETPDKKRAAAAAVMQLQAIMAAQKESMNILDKCFNRCVGTPGPELTTSQGKCIWNCTRRFFDADEFINKRLMAMAQQQQMSQQGIE